MAKFQCNLADPKNGVSYNIVIDESQATSYLIGKRIGETFNADPLGFPEYELQLKGGSDEDGFPMNPTVGGGFRKKVYTSGTIGVKKGKPGQMIRKRVRGNTITEDIFQLNLKITKYGSTSIEELLAKIKGE